VPELARLPWEYLYNPSRNQFLALSNTTPLVRYLDLPEPDRRLAVKPPMRVLALISSPSDYPALDVEQEWARLRTALANLEQQGTAILERLVEPTLSTLQERLRQSDVHIFHFSGHGTFDEQTADGVLLLENEAKRGQRVPAEYLGTLLHDHRPLRLAILNACEGARSSPINPFVGTAQTLVQQGIPAVIAMQFEVTDTAAITFAQEFYRALAVSYPVDAAVAEARKAIFIQDNALEWGTPVLFMRAPDGIILQMQSEDDTPMGTQAKQAWWDRIPAQVGGDVIIAEVGAGARGVAVGKNITQTVYEVLGEPTPDDKQVIEQKLGEVTATLQGLRGKLDATTETVAEFQMKLLGGELTKTEEGDVPSASTITQVGDWLLDNVPQMAEILASLFATPAVGKVVGKAGEVAVEWVKQRFGKTGKKGKR